MRLITKKISLSILTLLLNACGYNVQPYITAPFGVNVKQPRPYYPSQKAPVYVVKPANKKHHDTYDYFVKPAHSNEHHDYDKHEKHYKNKKHHD